MPQDTPDDPPPHDREAAVRWYLRRARNRGPAVSMYDLGRPVPVWPARDPASPEASARRTGVHVHRVIADIAPRVVAGADHHAAITEAVSRLVRGRDLGRMDRAHLRVSGLVHQYVRLFLPHGAAFIAAEVTAGGGRADLLWRHEAVGWFYDEIKTTTHPADSDEKLVAQLDRYRRAGLMQFGRGFAGVRLVPLGNSALAVRVRPDGAYEPLDGSTLSPTRLATMEGLTA